MSSLTSHDSIGVGKELDNRGLSHSTQAQGRSLKRNIEMICGPMMNLPQTNHGYTHATQDQETVLVASLRTCSKNKDLQTGTKIHGDILKRGLLHECSDALVTMYAKCGSLAKAKALLETHISRDIISWTALIAGFAREGQNQDALKCFHHMQNEGIPPNAVTYACILKACSSMGALNMGKQIHDEIVRQGLLQNDTVLATALVNMYAKCGAITKAQAVLEELPFKDVIPWNALLTKYTRNGQGEDALVFYERMQHANIIPDAVTFACILNACSTMGALDKGENIHKQIVRQGLLHNDPVLNNALVDMYAKCGALKRAKCVLQGLPSRDVVAWTALIAGYAQHGQAEQALSCFESMRYQGVPPNAVTYACLLKACGIIGALDRGKQIHDEILYEGHFKNNLVLGTALVDMYAKCGALANAQRVLEELPSRDVVVWSTVISGYAQHGQGEQALNCFKLMQSEGFAPNANTFSCALKACSIVGAIDKGEKIHDDIRRQGLLQKCVVLGTSLVDMYAKCGALAKAESALEELPFRDVVAWNALIGGYAQHGKGEQALNCFSRMKQEGIFPDQVTFSCLLNVCCHLGLVEEGHMLFRQMSSRFSLKPNLENYTCMIDLFGRAGHLERAVQLIQETPFFDSTAIWHALLGACRKWGDANVGKWAFERAIYVDKKDETAYVLMASIYAVSGMHDEPKALNL